MTTFVYLLITLSSQSDFQILYLEIRREITDICYCYPLPHFIKISLIIYSTKIIKTAFVNVIFHL